MSIDEGGPAFPSTNDVTVGETWFGGHRGLSKREWFAGLAMMGQLVDSAHGLPLSENKVVDKAYRMADAMVARSRKDQV